MANFLLVHGAWLGGWCWRPVTEALVRAGHRAHAVTLTGLGERAHLLTPELSLQTHIQDVTAALETEELDDAILVVHSFAGLLGTAVADRKPGRLRHLVYVDALVPQPGESWSSTHSATTREARRAAARLSPGHSLPPPDPSLFGLSGPAHAWVLRRQTPHPAGTYEAPLDFDPLRVAQVPRTFISCIEPALATIDVTRVRVGDPDFWGGAWQPGARIQTLATGHLPMVSAPEALTRLLLGCALV